MYVYPAEYGRFSLRREREKIAKREKKEILRVGRYGKVGTEVFYDQRKVIRNKKKRGKHKHKKRKQFGEGGNSRIINQYRRNFKWGQRREREVI